LPHNIIDLARRFDTISCVIIPFGKMKIPSLLFINLTPFCIGSITALEMRTTQNIVVGSYV
jgi:hypothetical protein